SMKLRRSGLIWTQTAALLLQRNQSARNLLNFVFGLSLGFGLPLHIARRIGAATLQWRDVIDHHSLARARARMRFLEFPHGRGIPGDSAFTVAPACRTSAATLGCPD